MRVRVFLVCVCVLWGGWVWAEGVGEGKGEGKGEREGVLKAEMETKECGRLIPRLFSRSADYHEGIDVYGKAVAPADGGGGNRGSGFLPETISFDVTVDLNRFLPSYGEALGRAGLSSGGVRVGGGGDGGGGGESVKKSKWGEEWVEGEKLLDKEERGRKAKLEREIGALATYEQELVWTRRAILGDTRLLAEELERLQGQRKKINGRLKDFEEVLLREKTRIVGATGGKGEKDDGLLLLRGEELREAEERVYYGEDYLRWQRSLSANTDAQERVKEGMLIRDKAEEEGEETALIVNEKALTKTRKRLEGLRTEFVKLTGGVRKQKSKVSPEQKRASLPYGVRGVGSVARVEYDVSQGLLTINGHPLALQEIKNLVLKCQELSRSVENRG